MGKDKILEALEESGISGDLRAETLSAEDVKRLFSFISKKFY